MSIPPVVSKHQIDSNWLSSVLAQNGIDVEVQLLSSEPVGTGKMAHNLRLHLDASDPKSDFPKTLIVKLPSPDPTSQESGNSEVGFYAREVNFYKSIASSAKVRIPRCYYSERNGADFVIVLEDLSPAKPGDQLAGVSLEQAQSVMLEAAKLHASHWEDNSLNDVPWIVGSNTDAGRATAEFPFQPFWHPFCERYHSRLKEEVREVGDRFLLSDDAFLAGPKGQKCLVHNDFRPDNMMFATPEGGYPVSVVDWQTVGYGHGASDLSYFLGGALRSDERRTHEESLLRQYHEALLEMGVKELPFDQLFDQYRFYSFQLFRAGVAGAMLTDQTDRSDDMFFVMIEGATRKIHDLEAFHLLEANC